MSKSPPVAPRKSKTVAASAARILKDSKATPSQKNLAASSLASSTSSSKEVVLRASKVIRDPKASKDMKTLAASALTQKPHFKADDIETRSIYESVRKYYSNPKLTKSPAK